MKIFDLEQLMEFDEKVLVWPPVEDFDEGRLNADKWYEDHKIRIAIGDNQIVLDYNADTANGLADYLKEQFENEGFDKRKPKVKVCKVVKHKKGGK